MATLLKKTAICLLSLAVLCAAVMGVLWFVDEAFEAPTYYDDTRRTEAEVRSACVNHMSAAEQKIHKAIEKRSREFEKNITERKAGSEAFTNDIVSFSGKWRAVKPYLPFTEDDSHKKYIQEKFEQHILSERQLEKELNRTINHILQDVDAIENSLAVSIDQEILGSSLSPKKFPAAQEEFKRSLSMLMSASQQDGLRGSARFVASEVSTVIAMQVVTRMLVSAGILSAGATSGWYTFGGGLVIGVVIDMIYSHITDSAGKIKRQIDTAIETLAYSGAREIQCEMTGILHERTAAWQSLVEQRLSDT